MKFKGRIFAIGVVVALSGCAVVGTPSQGPPPEEIRIAIEQPSSLDPAHLNDPASILVARQIFEPLVTFHPQTLALEPGLAARWEVLDQGSRFVFHLRPGATFHNGKAVTPEDVRFSLNRLARRDTAAEVAFVLDDIVGFEAVNETGDLPELDGVRVVGERAVEVRLRAPWFDFPYVLTSPATAPVPQEQIVADPEGFKKSPVGAGPFRLQGPLETGSDFVLERFDAFRGRRPSISSITFLVYERGTPAWKDFEEGLVDVAQVPPARISAARARYGTAGFSPVAAGVYLGINLNKIPDIRIRRAISMAIDRKSIAGKVYDHVLTPAKGLVPPGLAGARGGCLDDCKFDPAAAKTLVSQVFPAGDAPPIGFDYQSGGPQDELARVLKADLATVGLNLEGRPTDLPTLYKKLDEGASDIFRLGWAADYPLADWFVTSLFATGSQDNYTGFSDPDVDRLIIQARSEPNAKQRTRLYQQLERSELRSLSMIPIGHFRNRYAASPKVRGFYVDRLGGFQVSRFKIEP